MKKAPYPLSLLLAILFTAATGQAQTSEHALKPSGNNPAPRTDLTSRTSRVVGPTKVSNHAVNAPETRESTAAVPSSQLAPGLMSRTNRPVNDAGSINNISNDVSGTVWGNAPARVEPAVVAAKKPATAVVPVPASSLTRIYRVGVGDVLDVRLRDMPTRESTLFTVLAGGVLEYPLIEEPVKVEGLLVEEIAARLAGRIKVIDNPRLLVNVRAHASHNVVVTGLVYNPGSKVLRQEAVPLYVVLAEAVAREGASRATILRNGQTTVVDLADQNAIATLVVSGDLIKVSTAPPAPPQFYYVAGEINSPGEKVLRSGLTLTQSILASGGITQLASGQVKVMSQSVGAAPVAATFNIKDILEGRSPDPTIKAGDRLEVIRGRW